MITEDLISYIQAQRRKNILDGEILSRLTKAGWYPEDIAEAFTKLQPPVSPSTPIREPQKPTVSTPVSVSPATVSVAPTIPTSGVSVGMPELEQPQTIEDKFDPYPQPLSRPVAMPPASLPVVSEPEEAIVESLYPPVTPHLQTSPAPLLPRSPIVPQTLPREVKQPQPVEYVVPEEPIAKPQIQETSPKPAVTRSPFSAQSPSQVNPLFGSSEDLVPALIPKAPKVESPRPPVPTPVQPLPLEKRAESSVQPASTPPSTLSVPLSSSTPKSNSFAVNVPANAVISTYPRDVIAANPQVSIVTPLVKKYNLKTIIRILTVLIIVVGIAVTVFLFKSGYIPTPPFSFIKKDPKVALLATRTALDGFDSYTTTTHARISAPSFANITNGLVTGDRVTSSTMDSISVDARGSIHKAISTDTNPSSQYSFTIDSSLVKNPIHSDVTYTKDGSVITVPNLKDIFGNFAPLPGVISVKNTELDSLLSLLPDTVAEKVRTADVYHMLSKGIPPYVKNSLAASLKDLVQSAHVVDKGQETIQGVITDHYEFTVDRAEVKKFLGSLLDTFVVTLSSDDQKHVDEAFGATMIDGMDVWIGKSDGMTHQYSFSLTTPLSKVLNLDDKGIAGNTVNITWQTTYSDFNTTAAVSVPEGTSPVVDFVKSNTDQDIKVALEAFKPLARSLHNAEGSYGTRANPTGSCTNPNPSSLFSPVGHSKGATTAVGAIASSMNTLLTLTNGAGSCYSTQTAWAMAFPSMTDTVSAYCVDSTGATRTLTTSLQGTICK